MITSNPEIGNTIALMGAESGALTVLNRSKVKSLADLLARFTDNPPVHLPMLRSTAAKLIDYFDRAPESITIDEIADLGEDFRLYLLGRKYGRNSIRSYSNYVHSLVKHARTLGWMETRQIIPGAWVAVTKSANCCRSPALIRSLIKAGLSPSDVTEEHLARWTKETVQRGRSLDPAAGATGELRRILVSLGLTQNLNIKRISKSQYGIALKHFPEPLRSEVEELLRWKQSSFEPSRPKGGQLRAVTAEHLRFTISRLFGYATSIEGLCVTSLAELVTEAMTVRYVQWAFKEERVCGRSMRVSLGRLISAVRHHPVHQKLGLEWMDALIKTIPDEEDSEEKQMQRKEEKFLPHEILSGIPEMIEKERMLAAKNGPKDLAKTVMLQLLMKWLCTLPWRQKNIRDCRIGGTSPNLFKRKLPEISSVSRPNWVIEALKQTADAEFWQVRFGAAETKMHRPVHFILPQSLVKLLEEYLQGHRKELVGPFDPGTLFVNDAGKPMTVRQVCNLVGEATLRYGGKIVTPHLFRDIFAFWWLERSPEDYLTLSKLLWHGNIQTTIKKYGRRFNESAALARMENMLWGRRETFR